MLFRSNLVRERAVDRGSGTELLVSQEKSSAGDRALEPAPSSTSLTAKTRVHTTRALAGEPEVLIPRNEVRALQRYLQAPRDQLLYVVVDFEETGSLQPWRELVISPIKVDPIAPDSNEQGVRQ